MSLGQLSALGPKGYLFWGGWSLLVFGTYGAYPLVPVSFLLPIFFMEFLARWFGKKRFLLLTMAQLLQQQESFPESLYLSSFYWLVGPQKVSVKGIFSLLPLSLLFFSPLVPFPHSLYINGFSSNVLPHFPRYYHLLESETKSTFSPKKSTGHILGF